MFSNIINKRLSLVKASYNNNTKSSIFKKHNHNLISISKYPITNNNKSNVNNNNVHSEECKIKEKTFIEDQLLIKTPFEITPEVRFKDKTAIYKLFSISCTCVLFWVSYSYILQGKYLIPAVLSYLGIVNVYKSFNSKDVLKKEDVKNLYLLKDLQTLLLQTYNNEEVYVPLNDDIKIIKNSVYKRMYNINYYIISYNYRIYSYKATKDNGNIEILEALLEKKKMLLVNDE